MRSSNRRRRDPARSSSDRATPGCVGPSLCVREIFHQVAFVAVDEPGAELHGPGREALHLRNAPAEVVTRLQDDDCDEDEGEGENERGVEDGTGSGGATARDGTRRRRRSAVGHLGGIAARSARRTGETAVVQPPRGLQAGEARADDDAVVHARVAVRLLCHGARRSERREDEKRHVRARSRRTSISCRAAPDLRRDLAPAPARRRSLRHSAAVSLFVDLGSCFRPRRTSPRTSPLAGPARFLRASSPTSRSTCASASAPRSRWRSSPSSPPSPPRRIRITSGTR